MENIGTSLELINYYKWVKFAIYGREYIATTETREKKIKEIKEIIFPLKCVFNKKDGKVQSYYCSLIEGAFVILLRKVIFFLIFPLPLGRNQLVWVGWKTNHDLFFFFFFWNFFFPTKLWKINFLYFLSYLFSSSTFSYQPNTLLCSY